MEADYRMMGAASGAVLSAIRKGTLTRPSNCQTCGATGVVQGHHYLGYEREHWLDVRWLCRRCHHKIHAEWRRASRELKKSQPVPPYILELVAQFPPEKQDKMLRQLWYNVP